MPDNIKMKPSNTEEPNENKMPELILAEEEDVIIWYSFDEQSNKVLFVNIGNATMSMPEPVFYSLTKLTQKAAKKLLEID